MKRNVYWTIEAKDSYGQIIEYLSENWGEKEIEFFIDRTEKNY